VNRQHLVDADLKAGLKIGLVLGVALLLLVLLLHPRQPVESPQAVRPPASVPQRRLDFGGEAASASASTDALRLATWVVQTGDHGERSFVLVDKREAKVFVFEASGRLVGATPVLLGAAVGDDTVPGVAAKALAQLRPDERTTPAGRFLSRAGRNAEHEEVIWVDYDAAVSMHRVRLIHPSEHRLQRLASPTAADNRISSGCINVPAAFFDEVLWPRLGRGRQGVVYVLPETRPLATVFPAAAEGRR
jgi:hypothetical protein